MNIKKKTLFLLSCVPVIGFSVSLVATSCSQTINSTQGKLVTKNFASEMYTKLNGSGTSIESLAYGSNYNDGNYVFVYGTTADASFRNFLYGPNGNDGTGNDKKDELNFSSSVFIQNFFDYNSLGNGQLLNYSVSLILYVDVAPYNGNAGFNNNGLDGINSPFDKYTLDEVIAEANGDIANKYDAKTLPESYRYKVNTYKRTDEQAKVYREFIAYIKSIRPNGSFADTSGMIAFRKKTTPQKLDASDASYDSLVSYYTKGANISSGSGDSGNTGGDTGSGDTGRKESNNTSYN